MILARRMKLVLLTTNQTLIFVSVLEVSGNPLKKTGRLAPNAARLRKIKDVTSTTKTFRQRETDRIYSFCYFQSV